MVAAQLDVLERHVVAVEAHAARDARELLLERQRRRLLADRRRHVRFPLARDLRRHDVEVDERGGDAADLHLVLEIHLDVLLGDPAGERIVVRHDARAGLELGEELLLQQVHRVR